MSRINLHEHFANLTHRLLALHYAIKGKLLHFSLSDVPQLDEWGYLAGRSTSSASISFHSCFGLEHAKRTVTHWQVKELLVSKSVSGKM